MQLYILKNEEKIGPLEAEEVRALLSDGKLILSDKAWYEGAKSWVPLSSISAVTQRKTTTAAKPSIQKTPVTTSAQPMSSIRRDVKNLKANTSSTAAEVRAFLTEMQGKSPREMLGVIAQSNLMSSLLHSTAIIFILLAGFTGLAFALEEEQPKPVAEETPKSNKESESNNNEEQESTKDDNGTSEENAAQKMGVDQIKKGQPNEVNPFGDKPGDDILGD